MAAPFARPALQGGACRRAFYSSLHATLDCMHMQLAALQLTRDESRSRPPNHRPAWASQPLLVQGPRR